VAKDILDRNKLIGAGTPEDTGPGQNVTVNAQINTKVDNMSDAELADYKQLLMELKGILPADAPKAIEGIVTR
jgi:hypothetical protein